MRHPRRRPDDTTFSYTDYGASVTVDGIPATQCGARGEVAVRGPLALAIEDSARDILRAIREHAPSRDAVTA